MRLFLLTALTMIAFAANSVLNRAALSDGFIDPLSFAVLRLLGGVIVLELIVFFTGRFSELGDEIDFFAVGGLLAYMVGFSFAYTSLDTGLGALVLFGGVQITMFAGAIFAGKRPVALQWAGAGVALLGLAVWFRPSDVSPDITGLGLMILAAVGWGVYSLQGAKASKPLLATTVNFSLALPVVLVPWFLMGEGKTEQAGVVMALTSGGVTSALGYALWYYVLPQLQTTTAAVSQLTVPLIAAFAGFVLLGEAFTTTFWVSSVLVLGGIGISVWAANRA